MYLKKTKSKGKVYYQVMKTVGGRQVMVAHLGSIERMVEHKLMASGKTMEEVET